MVTARRLEGGTRLGSIERVRAPLVSIIVAVFQDRDELKSLIENICPFRGPDTELIVVDGGSDDGTRDLLQYSNNAIDYWLSEPDTGVYDAMNKGLAAARGEYILHLNAGDRLLKLPLADLQVCCTGKVDVVCFCVLLEDGSVHIPRGAPRLNTENSWHHQGTFYRRVAHLGYDSTYKVFGDFDHNQRLAKHTESVQIFFDVISHHGNPGMSASSEHFGEVYRSLRKNRGIFYLLIAFVRFKIRGIQRRFKKLVSGM